MAFLKILFKYIFVHCHVRLNKEIRKFRITQGYDVSNIFK